MDPFGPYQLIERLEVGASTETFFALGPGALSQRDPLRLTRVASYAALHSTSKTDWAERLEPALALRAPFERTFYLGEVGGRRVQVREPAFGIWLRELARGERGLPIEVAVWAALELCQAVEQWGAAAAILSIDERRLRIGWDGALWVHTIDLQAVDTPAGRSWLQSPEESRGAPPDAQSAVFRICAVLELMLTGRSPPPNGQRRELPPRLSAILERNLVSAPSERLPSIRALHAELEPFAASSTEARQTLAALVCSRFAQRHACDLARLASVGLGPVPPLAEEPRDLSGWLVLGDLLQAQGDPRGQLIALHARRDEADDPDDSARLEDEAQRLINRHGALVPPVCARAANFRWRFGFVRSAELVRTGTCYLLPMLLSHPSLRFVEELSFTTGGSGDTEHRVEDLCALRPKSLRVVKLPVLTPEHRAALAGAMPWLNRIELAPLSEPPGFFRRLLRRLK